MAVLLAGLGTNTVFYNLMMAFGMIIGRFGIIVPVMAIAGSMAMKKITPVSSGTFRTDNLVVCFVADKCNSYCRWTDLFPSACIRSNS